VVLAGLCLLIGGWPGLVVGFLWSTVLVYHATFSINSLAHVRGRQKYVTGDDSRNNWLLALVTMGEGWHNNHHAFQSSARQGFRWWEWDPTYYLLRGLSWLGIVWDLKSPPERVLRNEQRLGARVIGRAAEQLAARFNSERIARAVEASLHTSELAMLRERLQDARLRAVEALSTINLPHFPSRQELLAEAKIIFAKTTSLEEIIDRAYDSLLASVGMQLAADGS
jgi:stearoyl-CoA desaturase (Delta-9 desaturase)